MTDKGFRVTVEDLETGDRPGGTDAIPEVPDPALDVGFDFARRVRYPEFRGRIQDIGGQGLHVLPVPPGTSLGALWDRAVFNGLSGRCLLAMADGEAEHGFRLAVIDFGGAGCHRGGGERSRD